MNSALIHQRHMELIDSVNNSKTLREHTCNNYRLNGWIEGVCDAGMRVDLIGADLAQFARGHEQRPMCCGVFIDWVPKEGDQ